MPSENEHDSADELAKFLLNVMMLAKPPHPPTRLASVPSVQTLFTKLLSLREFLFATSNGDLSKDVVLKGYIGGTLKTLQANLKHMTWQTKMVASGDFTQRVEFMGEFSQAFNAMVMQLDQILNELAAKEMELKIKNDQLRKEISIRKQAEATLRENEEALRFLAITDPLTGLYNRRHFNKIAEDEIIRALRHSRPLSVIMLDIDFFKRINDELGHTVGDGVLKIFAAIIKDLVRANDVPARYGGEEFIILLSETPAPEAAVIADRLRRRIEATDFQVENCSIKITASFGVSDSNVLVETQSHERILSSLVSNADLALYASKHAGRNRITVYNPKELQI